jgi:hypothetical protein
VSTLTKADRDKLPESDFGWPERRLFPVVDEEDVRAVARLAGKAHEPEKVKKKVLEICQRKGLKPPEGWGEEATMSTQPAILVEFAAEGGTEQDGHIVKDVPVIFREGTYEFKDAPPYTMTREDILAVCADFAPVDIDDNHRPRTDANGKPVPPSIFKGKLGRITALTPKDDYSEFGGRAEVPKWLAGLYKDQPLGMSARFDRATKKIIDVALTHNPRITDAVLFAAFAEEEAMESGKPPAKTAAARHHTPHGQKALQYVHDITAHGGAVCHPDHSPGAKDARFTAEFTADHESSTLQKVHDLTLGSGAACALYRSNLGKNKEWKPGQYYRTAVEAMPPYAKYEPGNYALMNDDDAPKPEPSARERELELRCRAAEAGKFAAEAVSFAKEFSGSLVPDQARAALALYRLLAQDDQEHGGEATFSDDQGEKRLGRVALLRRLMGALPKHRLTEEVVPGNEALFALPSGGVPAAEADAEAERKRLEAYAERENRKGGRKPLKTV